jgi:DNA-binding transcriptional regulator YdaS (Cro superfamily)
MAALDRAIKCVGTVSEFADLVGACASAPSMWRLRGRVPAEHCPTIERITGRAVRCEELRPDVDWHVLRETA